MQSLNHTDFMYPSTTFRSDYDQLRWPCPSCVRWTDISICNQWFLAFTCAVMVILALLGFRERALPLNDKLLHFFCFMIATGVFYFIIDIEEYVIYARQDAVLTCLMSIARSARRIWFWRYFNLIFSLFVCFFCGGILSEVVQSLLPVRHTH